MNADKIRNKKTIDRINKIYMIYLMFFVQS